MALKRIMPALLYDGRQLVKTTKFKQPAYIGDPINAIKIYNDKEVDELILLDILATKQRREPDFKKLKNFASECFMPFAYGGGVKTINDFSQLYTRVGAEKVIINSLIAEAPQVVKEAAQIFGSQAVVASVDYKRNFFGQRQIYAHSGYKVKSTVEDYCLYLQDLGVGELFLTAVDLENSWEGFDQAFINELIGKLDIPVIVHGGAGAVQHIKSVLYETGANAAALGSMAIYQKKGMGVLIGFPKREEVIQDE